MVSDGEYQGLEAFKTAMISAFLVPFEDENTRCQGQKVHNLHRTHTALATNSCSGSC